MLFSYSKSARVENVEWRLFWHNQRRAVEKKRRPDAKHGGQTRKRDTIRAIVQVEPREERERERTRENENESEGVEGGQRGAVSARGGTTTRKRE